MGPDKPLHFIVSFLAARIDPLFAAILGVGKEVWDVLQGGVADPLDLLADLLGILAAGW